jgi:hypothetical protein
MNQPYSLVADWLDTFQTSSEWIQALWILAGPASLVGVAWSIVWAAREIATLRIRREASQPEGPQPGTLEGWPIYAIYRGTDGRWMFYVHGAVRELRADETPQEPPPRLTPH